MKHAVIRVAEYLCLGDGLALSEKTKEIEPAKDGNPAVTVTTWQPVKSPTLPEGTERIERWPDGRAIAFGWDWQREANEEEIAILEAVERELIP